MKKVIQLKTKEQFNKVMQEHNKTWKDWMWDTFKKDTCYIPSENCFISLEKAKELGYDIQ